MDEIIQYLITFLLGEGNEKHVPLIGYTADTETFSQYKAVIIPSAFFDENFYGQPQSLPQLPLKMLENIPILYGNSAIEKQNNTVVIHADLLASAYFLLTRYEEWLRTDGRDIHGRFRGKESLLYRAGFLHRPVVDEYGCLLRRLLRENGMEEVAETPDEIGKIYLTHDIDQVFRYKTLRNYAGGAYRFLRGERGELKAMFKTFFCGAEKDPFFTFPFILDTNAKLQNLPMKTVFFVKSPLKTARQDKPIYNLSSKKIRQLLQLIQSRGASVGLHSSYFSGDEPVMIAAEKVQLECATNCAITQNRHHFLRLKEPVDTQFLLEAGIADDFTLGYADYAGFRLGTCRAVRWIDLRARKLSPLTLHPLTMMDCSLSEEKYMNLTYDEALQQAIALINSVKQHHGELVLLWHNSVLCENSKTFPHRKLYVELINYLREIS